MLTPLKAIRTARKLACADLAQAVGVRQPTINRIENGRCNASLELADRIAKYFKNAITRDQILYPRDYAAASPSSRTRAPRALQKARV